MLNEEQPSFWRKALPWVAGAGVLGAGAVGARFGYRAVGKSRVRDYRKASKAFEEAAQVLRGQMKPEDPLFRDSGQFYDKLRAPALNLGRASYRARRFHPSAVEEAARLQDAAEMAYDLRRKDLGAQWESSRRSQTEANWADAFHSRASRDFPPPVMVPKVDLSQAFRTLGVAPDTPAQEVQKAYRARARQHHPDTGGDPERMKQVNQAYDQLKKHLKLASLVEELAFLDRVKEHPVPPL